MEKMCLKSGKTLNMSMIIRTMFSFSCHKIFLIFVVECVFPQMKINYSLINFIIILLVVANECENALM